MDYNLVKINKTWVRQIDDLYYVGDIVDVDGDGWVSREDAELAVYEFENCVPCCKYCNFAKNDMSYDEFKKWIIVSGKPSDGVIIRRAREILVYFHEMHPNDLIAEWQALKQSLNNTHQTL